MADLTGLLFILQSCPKVLRIEPCIGQVGGRATPAVQETKEWGSVPSLAGACRLVGKDRLCMECTGCIMARATRGAEAVCIGEWFRANATGQEQ